MLSFTFYCWLLALFYYCLYLYIQLTFSNLSCDILSHSILSTGRHYGTVDETRRLRKPDLGRVDAERSKSQRPTPEKTPHYQYGSAGSGEYRDTRPHGDGEPSQFARQDSQRQLKTYGRVTGNARDGGGRRDGPSRSQAQQRFPVDEKTTDQGQGFVWNVLCVEF